MVKKVRHTNENFVCEECEAVKTIKHNRIYYMCEECSMAYSSAKLAGECEKFCREHKSCNLELMKKACGVKL